MGSNYCFILPGLNNSGPKHNEYVTMDSAKFFAARWGSELVDAGALGHINTASDIGNWPQGYAILQKLINP